MPETTDGPQGGPDPVGRETRTIPDPAGRLTPEFLAALRERYEGMGARDATLPGNFPPNFADACDLVVQLLWPEMYGTDPEDPNLHTSDPARQIARLFCDVLGVRDERTSHHAWDGDAPIDWLPTGDPDFRRALAEVVRLLDRGGSLSGAGTLEATARVVRHLRTRPDLAKTLLAG